MGTWELLQSLFSDNVISVLGIIITAVTLKKVESVKKGKLDYVRQTDQRELIILLKLIVTLLKEIENSNINKDMKSKIRELTDEVNKYLGMLEGVNKLTFKEL